MTDTAPLFEMQPHHWDQLNKSGDRYKHLYGHAVVVSGPFGSGGAARLAARGALRIGAGLVSIACSHNAIAEHAAHLNAIMIKPFGGAETLSDCFDKLKPQAICIGPNLGLDETAKGQLAETLKLTCPKCVDADAITLLSLNSISFTTLQPKDVMTPHEGELRRFIPEAFAQTTCRLTLAKAAAVKANCVVLFKGADTVIAAPNGDCRKVSSRHLEHANWLATAGSGDVLSGFITGLLTRGFKAFDAASIGATLHLACAEAFGPGLIAEDIPEVLPKVLKLRR